MYLSEAAITSYFNKPIIIHMRFSVLHDGWGMDNLAFLVEVISENRFTIVSSSHGKPYELSKQEVEEKILEYKMSLIDIETAAKFINIKV